MVMDKKVLIKESLIILWTYFILISICCVSLRSLMPQPALCSFYACFVLITLMSTADVAGARLAHPDMYGQPRKLRKLKVTRKQVLSDVVQFSPALGKKKVYRFRWVWLRLSLACAAVERLLETHIACYNALNFWNFESIVVSQCLPIEVAVVAIIVCKCRWIPTVSKRNVWPLWQVASDEGVVFPIIFCTCRESRLLQKVMYNHFGGYDTSINRKSPVIRFFFEFLSTR